MNIPIEVILWVAGAIMALAMAAIGAIVGLQKARIDKIENDDEEARKEISTKIDAIIREYVRKDEANGTSARIEKSVDKIEVEVAEIQKLLVRVLLALGKPVS